MSRCSVWGTLSLIASISEYDFPPQDAIKTMAAAAVVTAASCLPYLDTFTPCSCGVLPDGQTLKLFLKNDSTDMVPLLDSEFL